MTELTNSQRLPKAKQTALWALQILTAAAFLMAGYGSLSGHPMMVETFDKIGIGQWFRYLTGAIEVASAIMLLIPRFTAIGAALLLCTMTGAVLSHLLLIGGSPLPALVLWCFSAIILWGRFGDLKLRLLKLFAQARAKSREAVLSPERQMAMVNGGVNLPSSSNTRRPN